MQVEVNNRPVLILFWWKNHLKGTEVEALQHTNASYLKIERTTTMCLKLNREGNSIFWPHVAVQEVVKAPGTAWLKILLLSPQSQIALQAATGPGDWQGKNQG